LKQRIGEIVLYGFYTICVTAFLVGAGAYFFVSRDLPRLPENLENINLSLPTEIYSADGELVRVLGDRRPVLLTEISPHFKNAIIAVEDSGFYTHSGIDPLALTRALLRNLREKKIAQGGSTITQQLSKNLFFSFKRDWLRKIKELLIALQMEATFTKGQILEAYCNQVYFGSGAYGVERAAQVYFNKSAKDLTLLEAAVLAGLPNSPNNANPFTNFNRAMKRAEFVLQRMVDVAFIAVDERENALASPLQVATARQDSDPNQYFISYIVEKLSQEYGKEFVHFGGLRIYTTLDSRWQALALKAAETHLRELDKNMKSFEKNGPLQTAVVAVENKTGAVRVLLGGRNFSESQFNRAVSNNRLPGSSFKPIIYYAAMETLGYSPATVVVDEPISIEVPGVQIWTPENFEDEFNGQLILKKALMKSINTISAKLTQSVTPEKVVQMARRFGITSELGAHFSLALGTSPVSPLEMAKAYSIIANQGLLNEPYFIRRIEDQNGNRIFEHFYDAEQRFSSKSLYPLLDMMQAVVIDGTGRMVRKMGFDHPAAGKTGTTNDFKDAWFDGFTHDVTTVVWVGYDHNERMMQKNGLGLTGGFGAAPIWTLFMQKIHEDKNKTRFTVPDGIRFEQVDALTGYLAGPNTKEVMTVAVKEETQISSDPNPSAPAISPAPARIR
jgi:penicillin-binding protein 1A